MKIFLITLAFFLIAVAGMAVGVIFSNRRIKGSCGGLANLRDSSGNSICEMCTHPSPDCTGDPDAEDRLPEDLDQTNSRTDGEHQTSQVQS